MIHVVLDTNVFSGNRKRRGGPFRALVRLCKGDKVRLHVPYVVKMEFWTQQVEAGEKALKNLRKFADDLSGIMRNEEIRAYAEPTSNRAMELMEDAKDLITTEWNQWLKDACAVEYPVKPSHGRQVIEDYFAGKPPYKLAKNRDDIPDSFVWHTIVDLSKQYQPLHVVTDDNAMGNAAKTLQAVVVHEKLAAFINTDECRAALEQLAEEAVAKNMERASDLLKNVKHQLKDAVNNKIDSALHGKTVTDPRIPDDNNEGMIYMINEPSKVDFDFDKVEYYGESEMGIPFDAVTECTLNYAIFKGDYFVMDEERLAHISLGDRNEHYFDADEDYPIRATGTLQIKLDQEKLSNDEITDEEIEELFDHAEYNLEVEDLEVADD